MTVKKQVMQIVATTSFFRSFSYGALWSFLMLFLTTKLDVNIAIAGLYMLFAGVTGAVFQVVFGAISDSIGRKKIMILGQAGQGLMFMVMGVALMDRNLYLIISALVVQSISSGAVFSSFNAMIADVLDENERFRGYALQRATANLGWGIGPAISGFLYVLNYYTFSFLLVGIMLVSLVILINRIPETNKARYTFRFRDLSNTLLNVKFLLFSIAGFIAFLVFGQLNSTYPIYEETINSISTSIIGLTWALNGFMVGGLQYYIAKFAKVKNAYYFMIFGILIYGAGYFMLSFFSSIIWLFFTMSIISLGEIVYSATVTASAINMAPKKDIGKYTGTYGLFTSIGHAAGPFYGGVIFSITVSSYYRWSIIFVTAAVSSLIYTVVMYMLHEREKR
ncbi:MAG: MFS transporter [Thermoplasmata archaeon]